MSLVKGLYRRDCQIDNGLVEYSLEAVLLTLMKLGVCV